MIALGASMGDSSSKPNEVSTVLPVFELRLAADPRWALSEGSQFFAGKGAVQDALQRITKQLNELGIPYAIAGGMALFRHGYRRFTEDVDILVTREGLKAIHHALEGRGYIRPFAKSKSLRDTEAGVKIEFLLTGDFPGDGKPKQVQFPDPASVTIELDGIKYLNLPALVELKLASGMTGADRIKDLADVQELIKLVGLPYEFGNQLSTFVREKYSELWRAARHRATRYVRISHLVDRDTTATTLGQIIASLPHPDPLLEAMRADDVAVDVERSSDDDLYLVTTDPIVAQRYGMVDESELMDDQTCDE